MSKCSFAIWRPGPTWKVGYTVFGRTSKKTGVVDHSAEGYLAGCFSVLDGVRNASWHFTVDTNGDTYQHFGTDDVCWHAGYEANKKCIGVEHCGVAGEPLTEAQYQATLKLHQWLRQQGILTVCQRSVDLFEHNEWMNTDCPSGRIPWARLIEDLLAPTQCPNCQRYKNQLHLAEGMADDLEDRCDEIQERAEEIEKLVGYLVGHAKTAVDLAKALRDGLKST